MAEEDEKVDPLGTLASLDQAAEELVNLAPILWRYFKGLMKQGFSKSEALQLVITLQGQILKANK